MLVAAGVLAVIGLQFVGIAIGAILAVVGMMLALVGYGRMAAEREDESRR